MLSPIYLFNYFNCFIAHLIANNIEIGIRMPLSVPQIIMRIFETSLKTTFSVIPEYIAHNIAEIKYKYINIIYFFLLVFHKLN